MQKSKFQAVYDATPLGWPFSYHLGNPDEPRIAVLAKDTLRKGIDRGFHSALGQVRLLDAHLRRPVAAFRGIKRLRYFDGEADWVSGSKLLAIVTDAKSTYAWDGSQFTLAPPPDNSVFVAYLYEHEPPSVRQRLAEKIGLAPVHKAKVCGYEWVPAVEGLP
ncbi:MAG: hypothetical protein HQL40_11040, partial [Alphaproteobacteria bacterium]|nr:hypothetical protein [Alphaproteobacteria bacterium]